ncbi:tumor necrosis factor alpha-induced protein 2 isoform X2 [Denticeps clupeoides]|nr:tumor necrosis factor alpha-induced protein 2-like isoform X2 [Denticeps clupeoides]
MTILKFSKTASAQNSGQMRRLLGRIWKYVRGSSSPNHSSTMDKCQAEEQGTFEENLQRQQFTDASQQLFSREEQLFRLTQEGGTALTEEEKREWLGKLATDHKALLEKVWLTLKNSLNFTTEGDRQALAEAVRVIQQQEELDRLWAEVDVKKRPEWRPAECRHKHDTLLRKVVAERLEEAPPSPSDVSQESSLPQDIRRMGRQLQDDLLKVVRWVKCCYPAEMGVCQLYAKLYHQAFGDSLVKLTEFVQNNNDCFHILNWVNQYYPRILGNEELVVEIDSEQLGPLLPEEVLEPLKEQYLQQKEVEVEDWILKALSLQEKMYLNGDCLEMSDNCCHCALAIDVIQIIDGALISVQTVLGESKMPAQRIAAKFKNFFIRYQRHLEKVIRGNGLKTRDVLMANLTCLRQFRNYVDKNEALFQEQTTACLSIVTHLTNSCHAYFTNAIHVNMKETYRNIGNQNWLQEYSLVREKLLDGLHTHIQTLSGLDVSCKQDIVSQLHAEVVAEYVRRMMKKKLKLKDKEKQEEAAQALREDGEAIHTLFTKAGSGEHWLADVLPGIAELVKLQDPDAIQLELMALGNKYSDLSEVHVLALLHLKSNLSANDLKKIKKSFLSLKPKRKGSSELSQSVSVSADSFFSRIRVK